MERNINPTYVSYILEFLELDWLCYCYFCMVFFTLHYNCKDTLYCIYPFRTHVPDLGFTLRHHFDISLRCFCRLFRIYWQMHLTYSWPPLVTCIWPALSGFCIPLDLYGNAKHIWSDQKLQMSSQGCKGIEKGTTDKSSGQRSGYGKQTQIIEHKVVTRRTFKYSRGQSGPKRVRKLKSQVSN